MSLTLPNIAHRLLCQGSLSNVNEIHDQDTLLYRALRWHKEGKIQSDVILALLGLGANPNLNLVAPSILELGSDSKIIFHALLEAGATAPPPPYPNIVKVILKSICHLKKEKNTSIANSKRTMYLYLISMLLDKRIDLSLLDSEETWSMIMYGKLGDIPLSFWTRFSKAGLDILSVNEFSGTSMLNHSVLFREEKVMFHLLEMGADIHQTDHLGNCALHEWVRTTDGDGRHVEKERRTARMFEAFEAKHPNWNIKNLEGETPLFSHYLPLYYLDKMLQQGAKIHHRNKKGQTPLLHLLSKIKDNHHHGKSIDFWIEKLTFLINKGSHINVQDKQGNSVLHLLQIPELLPILLDAGADLSLQNKKGQTPMEMPLTEKNKSIISLLQKEKWKQSFPSSEVPTEQAKRL